MPKINHEEYEILKGLDEKWKWIARDSYDRHDGNLFVYPEKPFKNHYSGGWVCGIWIHPINTHLFQFIQWENDEPWNIQELIEGYEDESEEAEVKNIEWAIKEIEGLETEPSQNYPHDEVIEREIVLGILNQLDEPEVLSQEDNINIVLDDLKEHIKEQQSLSQNVGMAHTPAGNDTHYRQYDYVLECINEYEPSDDLQNLLMPKQEKTPTTKQEMIKEYGMSQSDWNELIGRYKWHLEQESYVVIKKPTIPEFAIGFLDGKEEYALYELLDNDFIYDDYDELARWLYNNDEDTNKEREFSLVLAQRYGYEVEEEQKYIVRFNRGAYKPVFIALDKISNHIHYVESHDYNKENLRIHLTEGEIRALDDGDVLFEHFAVKAEEMEE